MEQLPGDVRRSPAGLLYKPGSREGHRLKHVMRHLDDIPDRLDFKTDFLGAAEGWLNPGGSVICDPDGKVVAGPAHEDETILYAAVRADELVGPRWQIDVAGNYSRPDVFELRVHRRETPALKIVEPADGDPVRGAPEGPDSDA